MNSKEISSILMSNHKTKRIFKGIFPRDTLPSRALCLKHPSAYVVNTDRSTGPGDHWVCVYFDGMGRAEYFDSFGAPPMFESVVNFITKNSFYPHTFNQRLLQSLTSSMCGFYVIFYIFSKADGKTLSDIQSSFFPHNVWGNDRRVESLVQQYISKR